MYRAVSGPYSYPGTAVLINRLGLRDAASLEQFDLAMTTQRFEEGLPSGRLGAAHYRAIHRHLFKDVYRWAGKYRTVRISRGASTFCYPENIDGELIKLFARLKAEDYLRHRPASGFAVSAAAFLAELNAVHAFRDGNGRAQFGFMAVLAARAGFPLNFSHLLPERFLQAMVASFQGNERLLVAEILRMTA